MKVKVLKSATYCSALGLMLVAAGCGKSSPTTPSSTETVNASTAVVVDARLGVSITAPAAVSPADGAQLKNAAQPLTLTVTNALTTSKTALTYGFQVASDAGFSNIVYSKEGVSAGSAQTSLQIDKLAANKTYYWRSHAAYNGSAGPNSKPRSFAVGPEVILQTPASSNPSQGNSLAGTPTLTVNNVQKSGPAGTVTYKFDVSDTSSFAKIVFTATVPEQQGSQTSVTVNVQLVNNATYYWRVQAADPSNAVTTAFSSTYSFVYQSFDMRQATIESSPLDLGFWPETAKITLVNFTPDAMVVDFDKRESADRWPDEPFGEGSVQYTLGMCLNINNQWYCSAVVQFWFGRELTAGGLPSYIGRNYFYDARWGPMNGHQPEEGEIIGMFVGAGNLRGRSDPGYVLCPRVCERSNVVLFPYSENMNLTYSKGAVPLTLKTGAVPMTLPMPTKTLRR